MPVSTPVRVANVIAALVAVVVGYRWWIGPERHVHRLAGVASALGHEEAEPEFSSDSATTRVTVQATTRDADRDEAADVHVVSIVLVKADGRRQNTSAHVLVRDAAL